MRRRLGAAASQTPADKRKAFRTAFLEALHRQAPETLDQLLAIRPSQGYEAELRQWAESAGLFAAGSPVWVLQVASNVVRLCAKWPDNTRGGRYIEQALRSAVQVGPRFDEAVRAVETLNVIFSSGIVTEALASRKPEELTEAFDVSSWPWESTPLEIRLRGWNPEFETEADYRKASRHAFEQALSAHVAGSRSAASGLVRVEAKDMDHFLWLVDSQVNRLTYRRIAQQAGVTTEAVRNRVQDLRKELDLPKPRGGRPRNLPHSRSR